MVERPGGKKRMNLRQKGIGKYPKSDIHIGLTTSFDNMQTSTKITIAAVIAVLAGPFLAFVGYQEKQRLALLEKEGVTVPGVIEGGESQKRRRSKTYKFDVIFRGPNGSPITQSFKVTSSFFKAHASDSAVTAPVVEVRYQPSNMSNSIIVGGSDDDTAMFPAGLAAFAVGAVTLGVMLTRKKAPAGV